MTVASISGKKRAGGPAKYVWQYFKRYKDPLGKELRITFFKCTSAIQRFTGLRDIILNQRAKEPTEKVKKRKVDGRVPGMAGHITSAPTDEQQTQWDKALFMLIVMCGISFNVVDSPWFRRYISFLHPLYQPPSASSLRKTWLNRIYAQTINEMKGLLLTVVFPQTVTLVFDGWTNIHYESVWIFIALLPLIALHYDITDKLWDGEYVTLEADAAVAPIGNDEDVADMDLQPMLAWQ
ncbi:TPA: hypothetical protein ACH3X1_015177 [Trebouxia sp. C0004]